MLRSALTLFCFLAVAACGTDTTDPASGASSAPGEFAAPPDAALAAIDTTDLRAFVAELSSDEYEGRGTGTPGEAKTVEYIISRFEELGLVGGMPDGSFRQSVPLRSVTVTEASPLTLTGPDEATETLTFGPDVIATTDQNVSDAALESAEMVFVGYGITNPGYDWDDFKDVDVTGKVLVSLVNDPPATDAEPNLFQADTLTYNGRWTYKYEEAERRGALGVLLIHTDESAGYPFSVLNSDPYGEHFTGVEPAENALDVQGWMSASAAERLAGLAGTTLEAWQEAAATRDFEPIALPVTADLTLSIEQTTGVTGTNVVAKIPGASAPDEAIVYGAHHDHLGIDPAKEAAGEDGIYNGAIDNASGTAMMMEIAEAFTSLPEPPARSVYFVTFSAEEAGLLGSAHFMENPPLPAASMVAMVNVDSGNLYGETDDIVGIGSERSDMAAYLSMAAEAEGMTVTPDQAPNQGLFFRSDQLAFARGGVPAVFINTGGTYRGKPADYAQTVRDRYRAELYHQPSDELTPDLRFDGILQQTRVAFRLGYGLATSGLTPEWRPSEAFAETRRQSQSS